MTAKIYIISGFLGAGKTTLIQKLLKEAFGREKVVLIENDFGEISVDAALLNSGGVEVREINSGCICCSLSGDFVKALKELLDRFHPDTIIIEPSGVGKLSDIIKACSDPRIQPFAKVETKITLVDVKRCKMYLDNFGEFFEDQITNADVVLFSRVDTFPDKSEAAHRLVMDLNPHAAVLSLPLNEIAAAGILHPEQVQGHDAHEHEHEHEHGECCSHGHCEHEHNHAAEDVFDTVTIHTKRVFNIEELRTLVSEMEQIAEGTILRAKGIVRSPGGYVNLQYLPGDLQITKCDTGGNLLCIIGRNLNRRKLSGLFGGE